MSIVLKRAEVLHPPFDCDCCGSCFPEEEMITLCVDVGDEHLIHHKYFDGHMSGSETEWDIAERMRDVLLREHTEQDTGGDYQRRSISESYEQCRDYTEGLFYPWSKIKAYALALEDDGWEIKLEEE